MKSWTNRRRYERRQNKMNTETQLAARLHATHTNKYAKYFLLALCVNTTSFCILHLLNPTHPDVLSLFTNLLGLLSVCSTLALVLLNHHNYAHIPFLIHYMLISTTNHSMNTHLPTCPATFKSRTLIQIDFEPEKVALKAFTIESTDYLSSHAGPVEIRPPNRDNQMPCTAIGGGSGLSKDTVTLLLNARSCFYFLQVDSSIGKPFLCHQTWFATYWSCLLGSLLSCALVLGCLVLGPRLYALYKQWKRERVYKQEDKRRSMRMEEKLQSCNSFYSVQTTLEPGEEVFDLRHNALAIHI